MAASREKLVRNAEKFVSRGRIEAAIREYRKVLEDQPRDTGTLNRVGDLYARINRIDEAVRLFTQIAEQYTEEGFFVKAIAIYKKIIKLDPTRLNVYEKLAELYHRQGLVNEARTQYQVLADYYSKHENATSAISIYLQMASLEPDDPGHRVKLAELYQKGKLNDKAMEQYQLIADVMLGHGRVEQAVQVLKSGLEIDPGDLDYLAQAVDKLRAADLGQAARDFLVAAEEHNPAAASLMLKEEAPPPQKVAQEPQPEPVPQKAPEPVDIPPEILDEIPEAPVQGGDTIELPIGEDIEGPGVYMASNSLLQEAFAEAEAAVTGDEADEDLMTQDDFLVGWDEEEAESLIKPPPDMAQKGPEVSGSGFRDADVADLQTEEADLTGSWELDLEDLAGGPDEAAAIAEEPQGPAALDPGAEPEGLPGIEPVSTEGLFETVDSPEQPAEPGMPAMEEVVPVGPEGLGDEGGLELALDLDLEEGLVEVSEPGLAEAEAGSAPEDFLSEAEVLAKYGLKEKAFQRVQDVLDEHPQHLGALRVLIQLHLEEGDGAKVRELAETLRQRSGEQGESGDLEQVEELLTAAGFVLDTEVKAPPPKPAKKRKTSSKRIDRLLASLLEDEAGTPSTSRQRDKALDEYFVGPEKKRAKKAPPPEPSPPPPEVPPEPEVVETAEAPSPPPPAEEPVAAEAPPPAEAEDLVAEGVDLEDHSDIEDALAGMEPALPPQVLEAVGGGEALDETGTSWLDEVEASRQEDPDSVEVFEEEEGFFVDLAAELEEELTVSDALGPQQTGGEQSLEEIVQGFKRGVEEQLSEEDFDTHFDLGIAYREMGLLDEAIGEFQVASKAPEHVAACCSMLGICFLEKGLPELAIKWYTRGLSAPGISEDDSIALLYDLGNVYLKVGDKENARKTLVEVYGINSHYRDVASQLAELNEA